MPKIELTFERGEELDSHFVEALAKHVNPKTISMIKNGSARVQIIISDFVPLSNDASGDNLTSREMRNQVDNPEVLFDVTEGIEKLRKLSEDKQAFFQEADYLTKKELRAMLAHLGLSGSSKSTNADLARSLYDSFRFGADWKAISGNR